MKKRADYSGLIKTMAPWVLYGGGSALLFNMLRDLKYRLRDQQDEVSRYKQDDDTIVIDLPTSKKAEANMEAKSKCNKIRKSEDMVKTTETTGPGTQYRRPSGEYGYKTADAGNIILTSLLAPFVLKRALPFTGGALLVNKLYNKVRAHRMKQQLEESEQDYLDALIAKKEASVMSKEAIWDELKLSALMTLGLGTAGVGYLVKRLLDAQVKSKKSPYGSRIERNKPLRIMFRSNADMDDKEELKAAAADKEIIKAALAVTMDRVNDKTPILDACYVKQACEAAKVTPEELIKASSESLHDLFEILEKHAGLRDAIVQSAVSNYRVLRAKGWKCANPIIGSMYDKEAGFVTGVVASTLGSELAERAIKADKDDDTYDDDPKVMVEAADSKALEFLSKYRPDILEAIRENRIG